MTDVSPERERAVVAAALSRAGRIRVLQRRRRAALATAGLLAAALATVGALTLPGGRPTATLTVADPSISPTTSPSPTQGQTAGPTVSATTGGPAPISSAPVGSLAVATAVAPVATRTVDPLTGECVGPLPPGHRSVPECDARNPHAGPPPEQDCISDQNSCAWPDAWGADPGGPLNVSATGAATSVSVSWVLDDGDEVGPEPVHSFDLKLYRAGSSEVEREVLVAGASIRSTTLDGVPAGSWTVAVTAVNNAGRCSYYSSGAVTVAGAPSSAPTTPAVSATASSSASPGA